MKFVVETAGIADWVTVRISSPERCLGRVAIRTARAGPACRRLKLRISYKVDNLEQTSEKGTLSP